MKRRLVLVATIAVLGATGAGVAAAGPLPPLKQHSTCVWIDHDRPLLIDHVCVDY